MGRLGRWLKRHPVKRVALFCAIGVGCSSAAFASSNSVNLNSVNLPSDRAQNVQPAAQLMAAQSNVVRIGYQKYGTLNILKAKGTLEKRFQAQRVTVQWILFPGGPQLLEALNTGNIDYGHTGEAPPIFAQAAGAPLVYIAHEPPNPKGEAIIVPKDSSIRSVAELKGKKVALNKGSNVHYLLVQALAAAKLKYTDIQPVYLPPADARAAFERGNVDAWVIWDPFYTAAVRATGAKVLRNGEGLVENREFYLAAQPFVEQYPDRVKAIIEETKKADAWAASNHQALAELLSSQLGIDVPTLLEIAQRRSFRVEPILPNVLSYQQKVADTFFSLGLLPKKVDVQGLTAWKPKP